jgi:hypothetical protein
MIPIEYQMIIDDDAAIDEAMIEQMADLVQDEPLFDGLDPYEVARVWAIGRQRMRRLLIEKYDIARKSFTARHMTDEQKERLSATKLKKITIH